jgi:catechol 2,3-dioxygenase-like lactoylglutathione lyase family enzyme
MASEIVNVRYVVSDVEEAVAWYTEHLDFTLLSKQAPAFADVTRGALRLLLSGPASSAGRPMSDGERPRPGGWNRIHLRTGAELTASLLSVWPAKGRAMSSRSDSLNVVAVLIVDDLPAEVTRLRADGVQFRNDIVTGPGGSQVLLVDPSGTSSSSFNPHGPSPDHAPRCAFLHLRRGGARHRSDRLIGGSRVSRV